MKFKLPSFGKSGGKKNKFFEFFESIAVALFFALLIRTFMVQAFKIPSGSMEPTLLVGDYLLVNKMIYGYNLPFSEKRIISYKKPERGEIIVFKYPTDPDKDFIKRIVAIEGDEVLIRNKKLFINDKQFVIPKAVFRDERTLPNFLSSRDNYGPVVVPKDSYFVMGDNRDSSLDSRFWGFVPLNNIRGRAMVMYFSWESNERPIYRIDEKIRFNRIGSLIN